MNYEFLVETYETERIKVLSVWSEFKEEDLPVRPRPSDPRGRSVREQMVHQCVSEDLWFRTMLGIDVGAPPLPAQETRLEFVKRYAQDSGKRVAALGAQDDSWWQGDTTFFRWEPFAGVGDDPPSDAHLSSSRAANGHVANVGARVAQQLWPDRRHRRADARTRAHHLRVFEHGRLAARGSRSGRKIGVAEIPR